VGVRDSGGKPPHSKAKPGFNPMAQSTGIQNGMAPQAADHAGRVRAGGLERARAKIKLFLLRSIFWSYERGSWQYDVICAVILAFIFLTPRSWFQDRPTLQLTDLRHVQGVVEVGYAKNVRTYQIDARLVESLAADKPEDAIREILERRLKKPPAIKSIEPIRDKNNVILGYTVVVAQ